MDLALACVRIRLQTDLCFCYPSDLAAIRRVIQARFVHFMISLFDCSCLILRRAGMKKKQEIRDGSGCFQLTVVRYVPPLVLPFPLSWVSSLELGLAFPTASKKKPQKIWTSVGSVWFRYQKSIWAGSGYNLEL